jgi:uncharacterized membrane-anchored protein
MAVRSRLLAALAAVVVAGPASAGKPVNMNAVREMSRPGPFTVELNGKGTVRVPTGFRYVGPDRLSDFRDLTGDPAGADEVGAVVPDDGTFVVYLSLLADPKGDPLADRQAAEVGSDATRAALLKWVEERVTEGTAAREAAGRGPQKVVGWTHTPTYDDAKKRLTFGVRVGDEKAGVGQADELHYRTYVYGPDNQVVGLRLVTSQFKKLDPGLDTAKQLAGEIVLTEPERVVAESDLIHYAKVGGAGILGVGLALLVAKVLLAKPKRAPAAAAARPVARKFGSPR